MILLINTGLHDGLFALLNIPTTTLCGLLVGNILIKFLSIHIVQHIAELPILPIHRGAFGNNHLPWLNSLGLEIHCIAPEHTSLTMNDQLLVRYLMLLNEIGIGSIQQVMELFRDDSTPFLPLAHVLSILGLDGGIVPNAGKDVKVGDNCRLNLGFRMAPVHIDPISLTHLFKLGVVKGSIPVNLPLDLASPIRSYLVVINQREEHCPCRTSILHPCFWNFVLVKV